MTLDMRLSDHREALRWACETKLLPRPLPFADRLYAYESRRRAPSDLHRVALDVVEHPFLAAVALRGLLEALGIAAPSHDYGTTTDRVICLVRRTNAVDVFPLGVARLPMVYLALLDIPLDAPDRRERALAALLEAGR